jgi:hypothetical protein
VECLKIDFKPCKPAAAEDYDNAIAKRTNSNAYAVRQIQDAIASNLLLQSQTNEAPLATMIFPHRF